MSIGKGAFDSWGTEDGELTATVVGVGGTSLLPHQFVPIPVSNNALITAVPSHAIWLSHGLLSPYLQDEAGGRGAAREGGTGGTPALKRRSNPQTDDAPRRCYSSLTARHNALDRDPQLRRAGGEQ